jgi:hypothetical protein
VSEIKRKVKEKLTSPRPSRKRTAMSQPAPPLVAASGVNNVKIAVLRMPKPRAYLPPNFSASIPPGR